MKNKPAFTTPIMHLSLRNRLRHRRRGAVTMVVAVGMVVILGFCALGVDYGILANDVNQLQRAADAAALAGSQELPDQGAARTKAERVARLNGVPNTAPNSVVVSIPNDNSKITVTATRTRSMFFARVLGISNKQVSRKAAAGRPPSAPPRIVPIGVARETFEAMKANPTVPRVLTYIRAVDTPYGLDNFLVFDLRGNKGKSAPEMSKQLIAGKEDVKIGNAYTSLNDSGNSAQDKFTDAIATIFESSSAAPWNDTWTGNVLTSIGIRYQDIRAGRSPGDNPRAMRLVVNNPPAGTTPTGGGTTDFEVTDFAPVYVESWLNVGPNLLLTIRYLDTATTDGSPSRLIE